MATESVLLVELERVFHAAMQDPEFTTDTKKIDKAIKALQYNKAEDRVRKQLEINAYKKLSADAFKNARVNGSTVIPPSDEDIQKHIDEGLTKWREKQGK